MLAYRFAPHQTLLVENLKPDQLAIIIAALLYVLKEAKTLIVTSILKTKDKTEENTTAVRELTLHIKHLNDRLVITEEKLDALSEIEKHVWKLKSDVDFAHEKIRDISKQV